MTELFSLDASSLYLVEEVTLTLRRIAAVGHAPSRAADIPPLRCSRVAADTSSRSCDVLPRKACHPTVLREAQRKEGLQSAFVVILWSKDRVLGGLVVGSRAPREFLTRGHQSLIAVGSQISNAIDRSVCMRNAAGLRNLRRTQEQAVA